MGGACIHSNPPSSFSFLHNGETIIAVLISQVLDDNGQAKKMAKGYFGNAVNDL